MSGSVAIQEIARMMHEAAALIERGADATSEERAAYRARKLTILDRIASDLGPFVDPDEAAYLEQLARSEVLALRMGARTLPGGL